MSRAKFKDIAVIKDVGIFIRPGTVCPSGLLHINSSSGASFGSGQCFEFADEFVPGILLIPEGGICRVEIIRRRQRCVSCGTLSWAGETIVCPGCQSQVFENI